MIGEVTREAMWCSVGRLELGSRKVIVFKGDRILTFGSSSEFRFIVCFHICLSVCAAMSTQLAGVCFNMRPTVLGGRTGLKSSPRSASSGGAGRAAEVRIGAIGACSVSGSKMMAISRCEQSSNASQPQYSSLGPCQRRFRSMWRLMTLCMREMRCLPRPSGPAHARRKDKEPLPESSMHHPCMPFPKLVCMHQASPSPAYAGCPTAPPGPSASPYTRCPLAWATSSWTCRPCLPCPTCQTSSRCFRDASRQHRRLSS